jgi:DNA-binding MarR family transcriptional regulator
MAGVPDVDNVAVALYGGISLLVRRLRQRAPTELSPSERSVLSRLDRAGPASAAELARAEQITPQAMGTTLAGLQKRALIERHRDPGDGRRILLSVSETGVQMLRDKRDAGARQLAKAVAEEFTPAELRTMRAAAALIERLGERL